MQDYSLPFLLCSQGMVGTESGSTQPSYLLAAVKGHTQDIHLAVWRPIKMSSLILTWLLTSVTSAERKKIHLQHYQNKGIYILLKALLNNIFLPFLFLFFFFFSCNSYTLTSLWPGLPVSFREGRRLSRKDSHH